MAVENRARVCVVDDDESVRNAMKRLLRAADITAEAFSSAADFLESGAGDSCGCVILDVRMPGMDGLALQEALIASGSRISVIMISAHDDARVEKRALMNGASEFFHKPFSGKKLLEAVRAVLPE
jgi:FixJ family two-component response regulator